MAATLASTTAEWFETVSRVKAPIAAFWQPTPARPADIKIGERWYFKELGAPRVLGYGHYLDWERRSAQQIYDDFGLAAGYVSLSALLSSLRRFKPGFNEHSIIGNVQLTSITRFEEPIKLPEIGAGLRDLDTRFRYLQKGEEDDLRRITILPAKIPFALRDPRKAERVAAAAKKRQGQDSFRQSLLREYGAVCAFTGPCLPETLQAAHIQPYVDLGSNHIENGILLRADIHLLFDMGLLCLRPDLTIKVSPALLGRHHQIDKLDGSAAQLPSSKVSPSKLALAFHAEHVFEKN